MNKIKIIVPVGCRSDKPLSAAVISKLIKAKWCECHVVSLFTNGSASKMFLESYILMEHSIQLIKPDLVLCFGDRVEMTAAACCAYHNNIKVAHAYAGTVADTKKATFDELDKHCISLWADIVFCEDYISALNVARLWVVKNPLPFQNGEFRKNNIHIIGITQLDDVKPDVSLVPRYRYCDKCEIAQDCRKPNGVGCIESYDFILLNNTPRMEEDLKSLLSEHELNENIIFIEGNPDKPCGSIRLNLELPSTNYSIQSYDNLTHTQFLGLLKHCERFITNSSAGYYEAPYFLKEEQIVWVGVRNDLRREYKRLPKGGSDKIVAVLKEYFKALFFERNLKAKEVML